MYQLVHQGTSHGYREGRTDVVQYCSYDAWNWLMLAADPRHLVFHKPFARGNGVFGWDGHETQGA